MEGYVLLLFLIYLFIYFYPVEPIISKSPGPIFATFAGLVLVR